MRRPVAVALTLSAVVVLAGPAASTGAPTPTTLRLDGVGPLTLGMSRTAAVATGWLADRSGGCPLVSPRPVSYQLTGRRAPRGIAGFAEFQGGRLASMTFSRGVRTPLGVTVGATTSARMAERYREGGFGARARYDRTFGGTFVTVTRRGSTTPVLGGFAERRTVVRLAIPFVPVCD